MWKNNGYVYGKQSKGYMVKSNWYVEKIMCMGENVMDAVSSMYE